MTAVPAGLVSSLTASAPVEQGHVRVLERGADGDDLGVGLRVHEAREAVAVLTPHALAVGRIALVEQDPARRVERVQALLGEVVGQLLDAGLVRHRRERVRAARRRLGRILPARAVDLVELLGLGVVRLHVLVGDRPRRRDPVVVLELAEVLRPQPIQRGAVQLGGAADVVVHLRLERRTVGVVPLVGRHVAAVDEHVLRRASSAARGAANPRARAAGSACPTAPGAARACRRRRHCRSRSRRSRLMRPAPRDVRRR